MRYRVDTRFGYASFDAADEEKAIALYEQEGLRLVLCRDLHDENGVVIAGVPQEVVITKWLAA